MASSKDPDTPYSSSSPSGTDSGQILSDSASSTTPSRGWSSSRGLKRKLKSTSPDVEAEKESPVVRAQSDTICKDCNQIDFQKVLRLESTTLAEAKYGILIADLGTRLAEVPPTFCALCRLLTESARHFIDRDRLIKLELRAFSVLKFSRKIRYSFCPKYLRPRDQPYLAAVPPTISGHEVKRNSYETGQIFCSNPFIPNTNIFSPRIIPQTVDFSLVTQWLNHCELRHNKLCGGNAPIMSNLKVIDCYSLSVILAPPSCLYVALSYVWSRKNRDLQVSEPDQNNATALQIQHLPRSIQDAITVTKKLGFQYLWVDRFCIDQRNPEEKHYQIQNMDVVYRGAVVTIIAAAGSDETYGLPGVGETSRVPQLTVKVQDVQIVCTMMHPHQSVEESLWSTRGWTYQEAVLSRRRLVFTDYQVYFECNAMNCYESLDGDLDTLHTKNKYRSLQMLHNGIFAGREREAYAPSDMERFSLKASQERYFQLIGNYSGRDLTFEGDSLNAFTGIARHLEKSRYPILHLWGIPFPWPTLSPKASDDCKNLSFSLLWAHEDKNADSKEVSRRSGFPSWSWSGWRGRVIFLQRDMDFYECEIQRIYFEFEPGILVEQSYFLRHSKLDELHIRCPRGLHLDVLIASPTALSFSSDDRDSWEFAGKEVRFHLSERATMSPDDRRHILENFKLQKWALIVIGSICGDSITYLMVVEQQNSFMNRVGIAVVGGIPAAHLTPGRIRLL